MTVALVPPVDVRQGDLIGIARLTDCGDPRVSSPFPAAGYLEFVGDVISNVPLSAGMIFLTPDSLAVYATGIATESVSRVIPVVGSTPGAFGSFFRTGVQLYNPSESPLVGSFVYHPAGILGSPADPSLDFTIPPESVLSYADLVETMGQSGLGSLDLALPADGAVPVAVTRVFNDAGEAGTSGFTEELVDPDGGQVLVAGSMALLIAPADATNYRFNIGVRTFFSGATLAIFVLTPTGSFVRSVLKTFDPTFFVQQRADVFLEGPIGSNDVVEIRVSQGSAVVYGATIDNTTNDSSIQFARVVGVP
jgi:hypothetical protein